MKRMICSNVFLFLCVALFAQQLDHSIGLKFNIYFSAIPKTTGASISLTYGIFRLPKESSFVNLISAYQVSVNGYLNGIGTRYKANEIQIDIHNSVLLAAFTRKLKVGSIDIMPEFHFLDHSYPRNFNVIPLQSSASFAVSSNFLINLSGRNQLYGSLLGQVGKFRLQHYNDGGIIMGNLKIGDDKDRWWTGGTFMEFGSDIPFDSLPIPQYIPRKIRVSFHKFTWDNQDAFEAANKAGLETIPISTNRLTDAQYNSGTYAFTVYWNQFSIGLEAHNKFMDLQDLLHQIGKLAKHPTIAPGYYSILVSRGRRFLLSR